ncbi:UNVERIFIED_CONTAM: hypothetical protein Slati_3912200 [Sesamum latifolium]|uniref:Reverse transcriptase RNase H-like domain-containing protein n=1 Tax=Sesamum latifolium TaxID=2727402 RepID=A0AAW2TN92_9LAMI
MDNRKVKAVAVWAIPSKMTELRSFSVLAKYYRRFIKGILGLSLKQAISLQAVLKLPQFDRPFEVQVDASDRALGGMLVQDKHVAFESRNLKDAEMRYNTHEKEMIDVIHCLEVWRHYLLGTKFTVVTHNVASTYFKTQRKLSPKQAQWQEFLGEVYFEWVHRPSKHNNVADALSRRWLRNM